MQWHMVEAAEESCVVDAGFLGEGLQAGASAEGRAGDGGPLLVPAVYSTHIHAPIGSKYTHSAGVEVSTDSFQRKEAEVNEDTWSSVDHIVQHSTI